MAISPVQEPGFALSPPFPAERSHSVDLCEFTLAHHPQLRQVTLEHANPLCRLLGATAEGSRVCDRGCGITGSSGASHACPFGMIMQRSKAPAASSQSRWVGRRFPNAAALHAALDRLAAHGVAEDAILAHLPANPIMDEQEIAEEICRRAGAEIIPVNSQSPVRHLKSETAPSQSEMPGDAPLHSRLALSLADSPLDNMLEYLGQVHALLASADQPARVCERFLKVVAAALPFSEMAILLRRRMKPAAKGPARLGDELVLTAVEARADRGSRRPSGSARTALSSHELGPIILADPRPMFEENGNVEPLGFDLPAQGIIALPLCAGDRIFGVWIASLPEQSEIAAARSTRLPRLLAEFLGLRLQGLLEHEPAGALSTLSICPVWDETALLARIEPEVARAQQLQLPVALMTARIETGKRGLELPVQRLVKKLRACLRPYDVLALAGNSTGLGWNLILPHIHEDGLCKLAVRVQSILEDELDATGGLEERGIKIGIGISILGSDAADARQLVGHAAQSAIHALKGADPSTIEFHPGESISSDAIRALQ